MPSIRAPLSRGAFLATTGTALAGRAFAAGPPLTTLRVAGTPDPDVVALIWGQQSGIFSKLGLNVELQRLASGSTVLAAVIGGSLDVGKSSPFGLITAYVKGVPLMIEAVAATYSSEHPSVGFVVAQSSNLSSGRDFRGKTVAVPALSDLYTRVNAAWIDQTGGDSKTVKFIELPTSATPAAIAAGRIDGASMTEPILIEAVQADHCKIIGRPFDLIANSFGETWYFVTREYAAKNADVLARFRRGVTEAARYVLAHRAEMVPLVAQYTGIAPELVAQMTLLLGTGADPAMLQPVIDFGARFKTIPAAFPAREMFDPAALPAS